MTPAETLTLASYFFVLIILAIYGEPILKMKFLINCIYPIGFFSMCYSKN